MIIAGPCLYANDSDTNRVFSTALELRKRGLADKFRCKLWGGGTRLDRYFPGIGKDGIDLLVKISEFIRVMTEVQTPEHVDMVSGVCEYIWVGARNCNNYGLLEHIKKVGIPFIIKRGLSMKYQEMVDIFDMFRPDYVIDRGVIGYDTSDDSRWITDIKSIIRLKHERQDIFEKLIIDCSHSAGNTMYICDIFNALRSIGCDKFMFECTIDGESMTDKAQMLTCDELLQIITENNT